MRTKYSSVFAIILSQFSVLALARIRKRFGDLSEPFLVSVEFHFFLFDMFTNICDSKCLSIFSVKTLRIRYFNWSLNSLISDLLLLNRFANSSSNFFKI